MNISILGSCNMDYIFNVENFPKAGQTLKTDKFNIGLGGKGFNQAVTLKNLGFNVSFLGKLGNDQNGEKILKYLNEKEINCDALLRSNKNTGIASIYVNNKGENMIIISGGANFDFEIEDEIPLIYKEKIDNSDMIVIVNEFDINMINKVINYANSKGKNTYFEIGGNNYKIPLNIINSCNFITCNFEEIQYILDETYINKINKTHDFYILFKEYWELNNIKSNFLLKLDNRGSVFINSKTIVHQECINKIVLEMNFDLKIINTIGAGDSYNSGIIYKILKFEIETNEDIIKLLNFGNLLGYMQIQNNKSYFDKNFNHIKNIIKKYSLEDFI